ncbi:hypothetical protein ASA1KI_14070 [Opitutales bacterium ASA1]|nr:hypothetical protein ASA1KI_14070 [Opitutales bacterium ASA1]
MLRAHTGVIFVQGTDGGEGGVVEIELALDPRDVRTVVHGVRVVALETRAPGEIPEHGRDEREDENETELLHERGSPCVWP